VVDLVLQLEQLGQIAVVSLGYDVMAGIGLNQLRGDTYPTPRFAHTAFDDITRPQFFSDPLNIDGFTLVGEGRRAKNRSGLDTLKFMTSI